MKPSLRRAAFGVALAIVTSGAAAQVPAKASRNLDPMIERGRYMIIVGSCNDCHTPGFAPNAGRVDEKLWLTGDSLGWKGPWGTTYPPNLRLYMQNFTEDRWVRHAKTFRPRPPMPWFSVTPMAERDLRAIYRYIKYLGPAGQPAPAYVPPGQEPATAYVQFPTPPG
jgi:mono/diheme cytochrome c family protein